MSLDQNVGVNNIELDGVCFFLASYLSWARKYRVYATRMPLIAYRGHARESWKLIPSLCRQDFNTRVLKQFEDEIIREFRSRLKLSDYTDMEILAYARHHGAPTRLLDWSSNPFVGLWFAVSDKNYDSQSGMVFQLVAGDSDLVSPSVGDFKLERAENCGCKKPIHLFVSPTKIDRTERQQSIFSIASFNNDYAVKPLDEIGLPQQKMPIRKFPVPAKLKLELRRTLAELGLDAYGIYGGPDALGKTLSTLLDLSDFNVSKEIIPCSKPQTPAA